MPAPTKKRPTIESCLLHGDRLARVENEVAGLKTDVLKIKTDVDWITNKVSANGRPGLENSLRDLMHEIKGVRTDLADLHRLTAPERSSQELRRAISKWWTEHKVFHVLKSKTGRIIAFGTVVLILNSLAHSVGWQWDVQSLFDLVKQLAGLR